MAITRRRLMIRIAAAAGILVLLRIVAGGTFLYGDHAFGGFLRVATVLLAATAIIYYMARALAWLWGRLLWRVRRRLVITYLFVGLTPIVLTGLLGLIAAFGISAEGMAHVLAVEVDALGRQALEAARLLAAEAARRRDAPIQERAAWLRPFLPNVRVRLDPVLPSWLAGRSEWQGVTHEPAAAAPERSPGRTSGEEPGVRLRIEEPASHAVRAVARASGPAGDRTVLLELPLDDAIIARLRKTTGIAVQPIEGMRERLRAAEEAIGNAVAAGAAPAGRDLARTGRPDAARGTGDPGGPGAPVVQDLRIPSAPALEDPRIPYMVLLPMTDWTTGETGERVVFTFSWSWAEAGRHLLGSGMAGNVWRRLLLALCLVFLGFEVLALVAAAWMTRAVTGTVHELYRATGYIDRGEFSHRVRVRSRDQLGELAESFNDMAAHIESLLRERVESERLQRELEIAATVQARLFPRTVPVLATVEIAGHCRAARGVAGDYYDYLDAGPGTVALALGDVAGKGISAALLMSNLQASLRAQVLVLAQTAPAARADGAVAHLASLINEQLCRTVDSNRFATLFLALYDDAARALRYTNAGHNPPILVLPDGRVERLSTGGIMVGAFSGHRFTQAEATLAPGSVLLLYSDGLSEAANAAGEEFGDGRLVDLARRHAGLPAEALRQAVFDAVDAWSRGAEQVDDQTLVVVRGRAGLA